MYRDVLPPDDGGHKRSERIVNDIIATLRSSPCTFVQVAHRLDITTTEASMWLSRLFGEGVVAVNSVGEYCLSSNYLSGKANFHMDALVRP